MGRPGYKADKVFFSHIIKLYNGCWKWDGYIHNTGYGRFRATWIDYLAHRFSYTFHKGKIPKNHEVHHLCNHKWCVNPDHLVTLTIKQHVHMGNGFGGVNARKTHCKNGHEFTPSNTYIRTRKSNKSRMCRACGALAVKRWLNKQ